MTEQTSLPVWLGYAQDEVGRFEQMLWYLSRNPKPYISEPSIHNDKPQK